MSDEGKGMRKHVSGQLIQAFAPSEIRPDVTTLELDGVLAIRLAAPALYYIGDASAAETQMPATVTCVPPGATSWTFTQPTTMEIMLG
ncbi:hypothetical protein [Pontibacterium sp.]|uniref:hypothetical protein n=1 Tax=Pontibacterium sp. TaxID=2036026 RepID=UPI0035686E05